MKKIFLSDIQTLEQQNILFETIKDNFEIEIFYLSDFKNAKILRDFMERLCRKIGIDAKWRTRIILIIDELNNNAIEHGSKKNDINILSIYIDIVPNGDISFSLSVTDSGTGPSTLNAQDMKKLQEKQNTLDFSKHASIRGRGLFLIISKLVDRLEFFDHSHGGLKVEVQKLLPQNVQK